MKEVEVVISVICMVWSVVLDVGWKIGVKIMSINSILDMHMSIVQRGFVRQKTR